jgi:hypothetical protein
MKVEGLRRGWHVEECIALDDVPTEHTFVSHRGDYAAFAANLKAK